MTLALEKSQDLNGFSKLYFYQYRPIHIIVGKNKNKINGILNQEFYLNGWMKKYKLTHEKNNEGGKIIIDNNENTINDYAILEYIKYYNTYYIKNLKNNLNIAGLGVILLNELKRNLKKYEIIELVDCAYNKEGKKMKDYYTKQGFRKGFYKSYYNKKQTILLSIFQKIKAKI